MSKEEKINKILEMSKEIILLTKVTDEEIEKLYKETKVMLEIYKKAMEVKEDNE